MGGGHISLFVMYSLCCIHLVSFTISFHIVDIFTTRYDAVTSGSRSRRQVDPCISTFKRQRLLGSDDNVFDRQAIYMNSNPPDKGEEVCLGLVGCVIVCNVETSMQFWLQQLAVNNLARELC